MTLGAQDYISFTTFKRDGTAVSSPVWVVPVDSSGRVGFYTTMGSGKTKRLRHTPRVLIQACDRRGKLLPGSVPVEGTATMVQSGPDFDSVTTNVRTKYGWEATLIRTVGGLLMRRKQMSYGDTVVLVTPTETDGVGISPPPA